MNRNLYACTSPLCQGTRWMVEAVADAHELWSITPRAGGQSFLVATSDPTCPQCGQTLAAPLQMKGVAAHARTIA